MSKLEELHISNTKISGSLEPLKNMNKLKKLDISDTDIDSGLEYLPDSVREFHCSVEKRLDAKVRRIASLLESEEGGDYSAKFQSYKQKKLRTQIEEFTKLIILQSEKELATCKISSEELWQKLKDDHEIDNVLVN